MSDLSAITGTPVNSFGDLTEFFGNPDNYANSEYLQNVLLPYAKTNWKLFVLFLTILFFFVFLVLFIFIWVYIFVRPLCSCLYCIITKCICCCLCGKKKDEDGEDGPSALTHLVAGALRECLQKGKMMDCMPPRSHWCTRAAVHGADWPTTDPSR